MAVLPLVPGHNTLIDIAKSWGPDGKPLALAELLNQSNELIQYMNFIEGNLPTGHKAAVRTALPTNILRRFYQGVPPSKSGRAIIEDVCAMQEGRNEIDKDLAELNNDVAAFRRSEGIAFTEGMNQTFAQMMIYGDTAQNKDGILGLAPRYNSLSTNPNITQQIIDAGGTGSNNTSVWLVVWGPETVTGIYPKGSTAGLQQEDLGVNDAFDALNYRYRAYMERWVWKYGLHVKDYRYAVRIANINVADLTNQTNTQATTSATWINKLMIRALARIPSMGMGTATFIASRTVKEMLAIGVADKSSNAISFTEGLGQYGKLAPGGVAGNGTGIRGSQVLFMGIPVLTVDRIVGTEQRVI